MAQPGAFITVVAPVKATTRSSAARIANWVLPEGAILAAAIVAPRVLHFPEPLTSVATFSWYAALGAGAFMGIRFGRTRLLFLLLILALADAGLPDLPMPYSRGERIAYQAIALLLPLNIAALSLLPERGLLTRGGLTRLFVILGQTALVKAAIDAAPPAIATALTSRFAPGALSSWTPLSQPALAAFLLSAVACSAALPFESGRGGRSGLWALAAMFLALVRDPSAPASKLLFAAAGLMLVAAVVETSFVAAYRDSLTGLPGRRALTDALEKLGGQYSIAMVDVDHFKRVNDSYGHDTGDQVLRLVGARLATVGMSGTAYRYGGEEFAIVFPGRSRHDVLDELERVREVISARKFQVRGLGRLRRRPSTPRARRPRAALEITVSMGVAEAGGRGKAEDVIMAADKALYKAKENGRNRVEVG